MLCQFPFGQTKQNFNWQFAATGAALNFDNCTTTVLNNSIGSGFEGQSSISDSTTGALLFYTDGFDIHNATSGFIQNGNATGLGTTMPQTTIVKRPVSDTLFYLFTPDVQAGLAINTNYPDAYGVNFAVVDMSLDGGLGAVTSKFNALKAPGNCEMLTAVCHSNREDVWLIGHEYGNNNFFAFLITSSGINTTPIITPAGPTVFTFQDGVYADSNYDAIGELKASPNGSKLAFTTFYNGFTCLVDFDNSTGIISNPLTLALEGGGYGASFSPDNSKLYTAGVDTSVTSVSFVTNGSIYQFNISSNNQATIQDSRATIYSDTGGFRSLKLGPDGKIYVARTTTNANLSGLGASYLGLINEPNNIEFSCNYVHDGVFRGPQGRWGLNNAIENAFNCNDFQLSPRPDVTVCPGTTVTIEAGEGQQSYLWNTGETSSGIMVNQPGTYWVTITTTPPH